MGQLSKIRFVLILPVAIIVAGCATSLQKERIECYPEDPEFTVICDNVRKYTYQQPSWIRATEQGDRSVSVSTYDYPLTEEEQEQLKNVYYGEVPVTPSCSSNAIGINSPITLNDSKDENTIWGRMDYGEIYYTGDFPQEFTKPCSYSGENVYAFCSEKVGDPAKAVDDKRVVICINQQTDDAKLAEEIFKTFKWIK